MINRKELMKLHGLNITNSQWAWVMVNHDDKFVVFQKFPHSKVLFESNWGLRDDGTKALGNADFIKHINLVTEQGYDAKLVQAEGYLDAITHKLTLTGFHKPLYDIEIIWDNEILEYSFKKK